nr:hypothetical protein FCAILLLB_00004 [Methanosarcinales archaeon ANME-2c ERB4]
MHAFWLDKTEHGNWPYSVYCASEGFYRFATEPVVADLDNDGNAEVIFGSWVQKETERTGKLHILDYNGNVIHEMDLPPAKSGDWNGVLAAPTLADIDGDSDLELVLNTAHSGVVAYDLPGTAGARVLWGTGRGSYYRNGPSMINSAVSQKGDLDCDGSVTSADVLIALKIAVSGGYNSAADMDENGYVNVLDARTILQLAAEG